MCTALKIALLGIALLAGIWDWRSRRIPNWLTLSGAALGIGLNGLLAGQPGVQASLLGLLVAMAIYVPLYLLRGMGAGDVKLMAALGALAGPRKWLMIFLASALLGGFMALIVAGRRGRFRQTWWNTGTIVFALSHGVKPYVANPDLDVHNEQALRVPHGTVIAGGVVLSLLLPLIPR
jgi:prepilin peptidase CpaA